MATKKDKEEEPYSIDDGYTVEETPAPEPDANFDAMDLTEDEMVEIIGEPIEDGPVEDIDGLPDGWQVRAVDGQYHAEHLNTSIVVITDRDSVLEVIDQIMTDNPEAFEPG